jgi:hypothetical protein
MNPSYYELALPVEAVRVVTCDGVELNLYTLVLRYRNGKQQTIKDVHVPLSFLPALTAKEVLGIYFEVLPFDGLEPRLLPDDPHVVLLGITTRDGVSRAELPAPLHRAKQACGAGGWVFCLLGGLLLCLGHAWSGALSLVVGTQLAALHFRLPNTPRETFAVHRAN